MIKRIGNEINMKTNLDNVVAELRQLKGDYLKKEECKLEDFLRTLSSYDLLELSAKFRNELTVKEALNRVNPEIVNEIRKLKTTLEMDDKSANEFLNTAIKYRITKSIVKLTELLKSQKNKVDIDIIVSYIFQILEIE